MSIIIQIAHFDYMNSFYLVETRFILQSENVFTFISNFIIVQTKLCDNFKPNKNNVILIVLRFVECETEDN